MALLSKWTAKDKERLRGLISYHLSSGGSLMDACRQFEFETTGRHKANNAKLRWFLQLRWTGKEKIARVKLPKQTEDAHTPIEESIPNVRQATTSQEESLMNPQSIRAEDESSTRLLNAVSQILEDRQQLKDDVHEHRKLIELSQRKVKELEENYKALELKLVNKHAELEQQERRLVDTQYTLQQLQSDYNQLLEARNNEYARLQEQIAELDSKYETLGADYANLRRDSMVQIESLEATVRNAEARNAQLTAEAERVRKENVALTQRITEFAQQISSALGQVPSEAPTISAVPIRPTIAKTFDENKDGRAQA